MTLEELFKRLSFGPLSNLAIANNGDGTILDAKMPTIVEFTNEALLRLFTRFVLLEKEVILQMQEDVTYYEIILANALSQGGTYQYVRDSVAEPFADDILRIGAVYDANGVKLPLNDATQPYSVFTPKQNILQVVKPIAGQPLYITYQARHQVLSLATPVDDTQVVDIPLVLEEALLGYIAAKVYGAMNGQENQASATNHMNTFNSICTEIQDRDILSNSTSERGCKLSDRGFV
jgi:hypothetical protein